MHTVVQNAINVPWKNNALGKNKPLATFIFMFGRFHSETWPSIDIFFTTSIDFEFMAAIVFFGEKKKMSWNVYLSTVSG